MQGGALYIGSTCVVEVLFCHFSENTGANKKSDIYNYGTLILTNPRQLEAVSGSYSQCTQGYYISVHSSPWKTCSICGIGRYSDSSDNDECMGCPSGRFNGPRAVTGKT